MKKILAIAIIAALALALCIGATAADADQWLCDADAPGLNTGWWFNPVGDPDDRYVTVNFTANGNFSGVHGFYYCSNPPANPELGLEYAVMTVELIKDGATVATAELHGVGDAWADVSFGQSFGPGAYSLKYTCKSGSGIANNCWCVIGCATGSAAVTVDANVTGPADAYPALMLIGADAPSQGGSSSSAPEAVLTLTPSKLGEFFEGSTGVNTVTAEVKEGGKYITFTAEGEDPFFAFPEPVNVGVDAKYAVIKYRYAGEGERTIDFYLKIAEPHARTAAIETDGEWHYAIIDCSVPYPDNMDALWDGTIARFDPLSGNGITGTSIDIASIAFYTSEADARAAMTDGQQQTNPGTSDASVIAIAAVACIALAGVVVAKKVR